MKGEDVTVAVKVRHPGVVTRITQDFQLLIPLARAASKFRALKVCSSAPCTPIRTSLCSISKPSVLHLAYLHLRKRTELMCGRKCFIRDGAQRRLVRN